MIKIAMIKTIIILLTCLITFLGGIWYKFNQSTENWKMFLAQDGIEFYVLHKESNVSENINTVIKILNTNAYEVNVSFVLNFTCGQEGVKQSPKINSSISANGANTMHNFKTCLKGVEPQIFLKNVEILKK
ncbi:MAG: hypothetical protein OHK0038_09270 [Flammeovirgaceae bacterium]